MIVVLKAGVPAEKRDRLTEWIRESGLEVRAFEEENRTVLGIVGDTRRLNADLIAGLDVVESVLRVSETFRHCSRTSHPDDTEIRVGDAVVGNGSFALIAGPCAVESEEQIVGIAKAVKAAGAVMLRGGAFKPRTSPYDFQGLREKALEYLKTARKETGLPIVTEITSVTDLRLFEDVDVLQVGARNMQNFDLLKELGRFGKPVLLKRGLASTLRELLMSAEYILANGNGRVILCERGIRTFSDHLRNTLDLSAVPALHEMTHLPVVVDPSHATGASRMVPPMALAAAACGADGLMIEVHSDPMRAECDGAQSLTPEEFDALASKIRAVREAIR
ncbi:MAG: 3-deoxy-7-phosphoheptulonate synthase [Clostridia bacterium]|nr:3-deoxy-7-phosphoheptulonate synthase [Clostridia bacterium]